MKTLSDLRAQFPQYDQVSDGDFLMGIHRKFYPSVHPRTFLNAIDGAENAHATIRNDALKSWWRDNAAKPMDGETGAQAEQRLSGTSLGVDEGGRVGAVARSALQGLTFGGGDEAVAAGASLLGGNPYEFELARERARLSQGREQYPVSSIAAEIGGAVALPGIGAAGAVGQGASLPARAAIGGATGAAMGAAYGFGAGEGGVEQRALDAGGGALFGGAVGAAIPVAGAAIRAGAEKVASNRAFGRAISAADSPDQMRAAANQLYQQADQVTGLPRQSFTQSAQGIINDAARKGMDADLTPGAAKVADRIADAATDPQATIGFRELDILRRKAAVPAGNIANRTESAIGSQMVEGIDDFISSVDPNLSGVVKEARDLWGTLRRVEMVQGAIAKARNTASGFENGLRGEFRKILNNPKLRRGLNAQEIAAMEQVVRGTKAGNLLRQIGRIGIGLSGQSNGLGAAIGGIAGTAAGGPIGGAAAIGLGTGAKALAERSTRSAADRALGMVSARNALANLPRVALPGIETGANAIGFGALPQSVDQFNALRILR